MAYRHGLYIQESPTPVVAPVEVDSALAIAVGVAPVHQLENIDTAVNELFLAHNFEEAVSQVGYSDNWKKFTLCEIMYSHFKVHGVGPLVMTNVWKPTSTDVPAADKTVTNGILEVGSELTMINTVVVKKKGGTGTAYVRGRDYELRYEHGKLNLYVITGGDSTLNAIPDQLSVAAKAAATPAVTKTDVIGRIDTTTGKRSGIELIDEVFMQFPGKVPGFVTATGWNHIPEVGAALIGKAKKVSSDFTCIALLDAPTTGDCKLYSKVSKWKNDNGYISQYAFVDWPCVAIGDKVFHASTRLAGGYAEVDASHEGLPYEQCSNLPLSMTKLCDEDGNTIPMLTIDQANMLNESGVGTFIQYDGWRYWGDESSAYPGNTDIKDYERSVRRMFCFVENVMMRTLRQKVDRPVTRLWIDTVLLTGNEYINTLMSRGAVLGGKVECLKADNNTQGLISGKVFFRIHLTPPNAAKDVTLDFSYDVSNLDNLFEAA